MRGRYGQLTERKRPELGCWVMNSVRGYHTEGTAVVLTHTNRKEKTGEKGSVPDGRGFGQRAPGHPSTLLEVRMYTDA